MALLILSDPHIGEAQGVHVAVLDANPQLIEAVGGVADLQNQRLALVSGGSTSHSSHISPLRSIGSALRSDDALTGNRSIPHCIHYILANLGVSSLGFCQHGLDLFGTNSIRILTHHGNQHSAILINRDTCGISCSCNR